MAGKSKTAAVEASEEDLPDETASTPGGKKSNLSAAKGAKNDEFYTLWADIERDPLCKLGA